MLGLYYRVWVDCIRRSKLQPANKRNWPVMSMIFMTMAMVMNLLLFMTIIEKHFLGIYFYRLEFPFLFRYWNNVLTYLILFILPVLTINYFLIFRNKRYRCLLNRYPYYKGRLFLAYFVISLLLPILLLWVGIIFYS